MKKLFFLFLLALPIRPFAQMGLTWYGPSAVEGICVNDTNDVFYRLPAYMRSSVRQPVWALSKNTAGEFLHFKTTARTIIVRYVVEGKQNPFPHMPEMGVSGVDLYAIDMNGDWNWAAPKYRFGDTCVFTYNNLYLKSNQKTADFYLFLPLYNTVKWLSVGVASNAQFKYEKTDKGKPIIAYGTSILQGAVASRAGLAWTNILERRLDRTVINLGFSGNGRFEKPIFDLMAKRDAAVYILDCMPNLDGGRLPDSTIENRVFYGVKALKRGHPEVPIVLVGHAGGYAPFNMDTASVNRYHRASLAIIKIFDDLKAAGTSDIYLLTDKEIGFDINSTTEGLHPDDIGMMHYADAYEKLIRNILQQPKGNVSTEVPVEQYRDGYDWLGRHSEIVSNMEKQQPNVIIFGNSIVNYWGGKPTAISRGAISWNKYMEPLGVQNAGFGWDRIENVLWRIYHGALDNFHGKYILVMIGTNNLGINSDDEIVKGLQFLLGQIAQRNHQAKITMVGILPRRGLEKRVSALNLQIQTMALANHFTYVDFGRQFLKDDMIDSNLFMSDGLHPNENGYEILGKEIKAILQ